MCSLGLLVWQVQGKTASFKAKARILDEGWASPIFAPGPHHPETEKAVKVAWRPASLRAVYRPEHQDPGPEASSGAPGHRGFEDSAKTPASKATAMTRKRLEASRLQTLSRPTGLEPSHQALAHAEAPPSGPEVRGDRRPRIPYLSDPCPRLDHPEFGIGTGIWGGKG